MWTRKEGSTGDLAGALGRMQPRCEWHRLTILRALASRLGRCAVLRVDRNLILPKIPSKTAKFHLQIVENRLEFQPKILPRWRPWGTGSCPPRSSPAAAAWEQARHLRLKPLAHPSPLRFWRARERGAEGETVGVRRAKSKPDAENDNLCPQQRLPFRVGNSHSPAGALTELER